MWDNQIRLNQFFVVYNQFYVVYYSSVGYISIIIIITNLFWSAVVVDSSMKSVGKHQSTDTMPGDQQSNHKCYIF